MGPRNGSRVERRRSREAATAAEREAVEAAAGALEARRGVMALHASWDLEAALWWQIARRHGAIVPEALLAGQPRAVRAALTGRRFRGLPDPFEPLLDLWALGYAPGGLRDDGVVVGVCPAAG